MGLVLRRPAEIGRIHRPKRDLGGDDSSGTSRVCRLAVPGWQAFLSDRWIPRGSSRSLAAPRTDVGPCREVREDQPLMVCTHDPEPEPLEGVRRLGIEDIDVFMPAAIDMFTEEVGVSPIAGGRGPAIEHEWRSRFLRAGCTGGSITAKRSSRLNPGQLAGECATARRVDHSATSRQWTVDQCPVGRSQNRPRRTCAANQPVRQQP